MQLHEFTTQAAAGVIPEIRWEHGDDLCECNFQRIGDWTNPYTARTLRVRMCCIWADLYKQYPEFVQEIPAYYDENSDRWETEPREWDGEIDMPPHLWFRHLAALRGEPLDVIREKFADVEPPKGTPRPKPEPQGVALNIYEIAGRQAEEIEGLRQGLGTVMNILKQLKDGTMTLEDVTMEGASEA